MAWHEIKHGQDHSATSGYHEFLIDSSEDINNKPTEFGEIACGSIAYTPYLDAIYIKSSETSEYYGGWVDITSSIKVKK